MSKSWKVSRVSLGPLLTAFLVLIPQITQAQTQTVRLVLDGSLLIVDSPRDESTWVALAGIGAPRTVDPNMPRPFRLTEVAPVLAQWLEGQPVHLTEDKHTERDPQGYRVFYASRSEDGYDWGWGLIRAGYAYARRDYEYERKALYIDAEEAARAEGAGIWPIPAPSPPSPKKPSWITKKHPFGPTEYSDRYRESLKKSWHAQQARATARARARNQIQAGLLIQNQVSALGMNFDPQGGGGIKDYGGYGNLDSNGTWNGYSVHVNGHWRRTPSGGRTWVNSHYRRPPGMARPTR